MFRRSPLHLRLNLFISIVFSLGAIFGCGSKPGSKGDGENPLSGAGFHAALELVSKVDQSLLVDFPSRSVEYFLKARLTLMGQALALQEFTLDLKEEGRIVLTSNAEGEIFWKEKIHYSLAAKNKKPVLIQRFLHSKNQKETNDSPLQLAFAINPFADDLDEKTAEFMPLDVSKLALKDESLYQNKLAALKAETTQLQLRPLNPDLKLTYLKLGPKGGEFSYQFTSDLEALIVDNKDQLKPYPVLEGEYFIQFVFATEQGQILARAELPPVKMDKGQLKIGGKLEVPILQKEAIRVHFALLPTNPLLTNFYSSTLIGKMESWGDGISLNTKQDEGVLFKDLKDGATQAGRPQSSRLYFSHLKIDFDYIQDGETPTKRSLVYRSQICVFDQKTRQELSSEDLLDIEVYRTDGERVPSPNIEGGCLSWNEVIHHKYYMPENFIRRVNRIIHKPSNTQFEAVSYINPWTILTLGRDERAWDQDLLEKLKNREVVYSRLFLERYDFETIDVNYHIDRFLTLFVRKNIQLDLEFEVTRYSSLTDGINAKEDIRDGVYLLKVAIEKSYIDTRKSAFEMVQKPDSILVKQTETRKPIEYIYVVNKLVRVWNGHIIEPIELSMHDLRLMTVRSNFLVQLQTIDQDLLELKKNFDIKELATDRVIEKIKKHFPNQEPDLDLLVDHNSGLPTRTFVGPMILLEMEDGADVRPTDSINVCATDDCNFLERENQELQKQVFPHERHYYSGIRHLINKSVDDLRKQKELVDLKYTNQKNIESLLSTYLKTFKLRYVSDTSEEILSLPANGQVFTCPYADITKCLIADNSYRLPYDGLLESMNKNSKKHFANYLDLFKTLRQAALGEIKDPTLQEGLCLFWHKQMNLEIKPKEAREPSGRLTSFVYELADICDQNQIFSMHALYRTNDIEHFHFLGGKTVNFDLGSKKSIEFKEAFVIGAELATGVELNPLAWLSSISSALGDFISGSVSYSVAGSSESEYAHGEESEANSGTYLAMQRASFDIAFKDPLPCVEIRLNQKSAKALYKLLIQYQDTISADLGALAEGLLLCSQAEKVDEPNKTYREHYYYFAQHFTEGHMLDDGSLLNHPWLLGLRGVRDYTRFVELLSLKPSTKRRSINGVTEFFSSSTGWILDNPELIKEGAMSENPLSELPLDQISGAFDGVMPSFPGIFVLTKEKKEFPYD